MCFTELKSVIVSMVCTVVTGITKIATPAAISPPDSFTLAVAVTLIILLAIKELATAHRGPRLELLGRYVLIAIIPLLFMFALIVITKIMAVW